MKTSFWYAIRELRRRPRQFLSLTAVSAAVMTVLMLMILWMNATWRAEVLPLNQSNTHMHFYNLTESEKDYIRQLDYVQTTYDEYDFEMAEFSNPAYLNCFRVRLTWEHNADAPTIAVQLMKKLNLYTREPYVKKYEHEYNRLVDEYKTKWGGAK